MESVRFQGGGCAREKLLASFALFKKRKSIFFKKDCSLSLGPGAREDPLVLDGYLRRASGPKSGPLCGIPTAGNSSPLVFTVEEPPVVLLSLWGTLF